MASICKIISEQFTKRAYNLEDFLDHGYGTLMDGELKRSESKKRKEREKEVVVEYKIPKRIFTRDIGDEKAETDLVKDLWNFD